ncbi:ZYRO0E10142p [Zygosaccharomyces rouxii]|uniref:ZYRO0E10142p n=1 Tax=Zygosaccharomyces rouxii (strain ATCC 2623 / CBS 732 / NBRC 1130 / NCYC 568 / NRRL Y-229) TaxID=559307 RepID=C5E4Z8_ZYGRC|nr:uncharacterized protein ZYRO0E10142g [Zygosaccharomyces rouxii]KAH9198024.1 major facilitator superfamily domain-containing protein [Zygosaccharomyces rouxii]CAR31109.1 ZYRO0E10142p [Zygosaccharomyces rouxii]
MESQSSSEEHVVVDIIDKDKSVEENAVKDSTEINDQEKKYAVVKSKDTDVVLKFMEEHDSEVPEITPDQERTLRRKVALIIVGFTFLIDLTLYSDKAVLSYDSILGLFQDTGLTQNTYNDANTLFYVGYLIGQFNLIFVQKFSIGRVVAIMTGVWTIVIFLHCTAYNYQGIIALRFFLGFVESIAVPTLNITMNQFLTPSEKNSYGPIWYISSMGVTIPVGFIAYGILYAKSNVPTWKLFTIIIGGCTFLITILVFLWYPNNPADAKFLSTNEKVWVIRRVQKSSRASIEQKVIKKYQIVEAVKDPITWLFFLFFLTQQLANNLAYQQNLLFEGLGHITNLDSTLVSVASGGFASVCSIVATVFLLYTKDYTAFSVVFWSIPSFASSIALTTIPWDKRIALLAMLCVASPLFGIPWILMFSWNTTSCSGYTKRITRNAIVMIGYSISNIISPQIWRAKDAPRYIPAWIVQIVLSFFFAPMLALVVRYILKKRNVRRLTDLKSNNGLVEIDGEAVKVDVAMLDLTDLENKSFIYPL